VTTVETSLEALVSAYLNDTELQHNRDRITRERNNTVPVYKHFVGQFISGEISLPIFRSALHKRLQKDSCWGESRWYFLQQFNNFASYHAELIPDTEGALRTIIMGLNASTLGQRIEQFYQRILLDKQHLLKQPDVHRNKIAHPASSAPIISLLAFWLDQAHKPYIYHAPMRLGLALLLKEKLIPSPLGIRIVKGNTVEIISEADHRAVVTALDGLAAAAPRLKTDDYWAEAFLTWIQNQAKSESNFFKNTYVFVEPEEAADEAAIAEMAVSEAGDEDTTASSETIENENLKPTPEPLLTQLIAELRRHILIDENTVRDIYHALLGGHLILTGPPGTGKTQLARLIPEILWRSEEIIQTQGSSEGQATTRLSTRTAYTTMLVTATAKWNTRTLISSIMPVVREEKVSYQIQYGYLIQAILRNWAANLLAPEKWEEAQRKRLRAKSASNGAQEEEFHGHWLIIDEFNRASIDSVLGEALTALSTGEAIQLMIAGKPVKLPLPKDFRIIGTLNSFDRHYLNQMSEALKRRFTFIEVLPPSRVHRKAEQAMVLYKALQDIAHISDAINIDNTEAIWSNVVTIGSDSSGTYQDEWNDQEHPLHKIFYEIAWPLFEVIRIYRQLGTAQAIALLRQVLIKGILGKLSNQEQWLAAFDSAFTNVIANQLQVLLSDELDVLLWYLKLDREQFIARYQDFIYGLSMKRRRMAAHLEALHRIVDPEGKPLLTDFAVERFLDEEEDLRELIPEFLPPTLLTEAFHLDRSDCKFPQFIRRLRTFKAEQGL